MQGLSPVWVCAPIIRQLQVSQVIPVQFVIRQECNIIHGDRCFDAQSGYKAVEAAPPH